MLGKHSGRHAVESRLQALGLALSTEEIDDVTTKVKELADRKKFVYDDDLLTLVVARLREQRARLVRYQVGLRERRDPHGDGRDRGRRRAPARPPRRGTVRWTPP